jgi:hypothetical protein
LTDLAAESETHRRHLLFHVTHHQQYTAPRAVGETTALTIAVQLPIALTLRLPPPRVGALRTPPKQY